MASATKFDFATATKAELEADDVGLRAEQAAADYSSGPEQVAYGLTFAAWLDAMGGLRADQDPTMLRTAWRAGENPVDYAVEASS